MDDFEAIRQLFSGLTPDQRQEIMSDYCQGCWIWDPNHACQCRNDE